MKEIKEQMEKTKSVLAKNVTLSGKEVDALFLKLMTSNKPKPIAGTFDNILDLDEEKIEHFKTSPYIWKPLAGGNIWGGTLMDDTLDYVHLVLASENVVEYIMKL